MDALFDSGLRPAVECSQAVGKETEGDLGRDIIDQSVAEGDQGDGQELLETAESVDATDRVAQEGDRPVDRGDGCYR